MQVPQLLRDAGFRLTTMREHYGETQAQSVSDHKWIAMTAECGWIGFHKDANIRRNAVERRTVLDTGARLFCVPRADIWQSKSRHGIMRPLRRLPVPHDFRDHSSTRFTRARSFACSSRSSLR